VVDRDRIAMATAKLRRLRIRHPPQMLSDSKAIAAILACQRSGG